MHTFKFYPRQEPQPEELTSALIDTQWNTLKRFGLTMRAGVVPATALASATGDAFWGAMGSLQVTSPAANYISVSSGMAFVRCPVSVADTDPQDPANGIDSRMERVFIPPGDTTLYDTDPTGLSNTVNRVDSLGNLIPLSSGHTYVPLVPGNTYKIYITYLRVVDTATVKEGDPANQYSVNPESGTVSYTHWVDGYQICAFTPDLVPADTSNYVLLATAVNNAGNITITDERQYCGTPTPLVRGRVDAALLPATYATASSVSLSEHLNSAGDFSAISPTNPHGTRIEDIPGLEAKFGIFSDMPTDFYTAGIVDNVSRPGSFWPQAGTADGDAAIAVLLPATTSQALYLGQYRYTSTSTYYSSNAKWAADDSDVIPTPTSTSPAPASAYAWARFPSSLPAGRYVVFAQRVTVSGVSGLAIRYLPITASFSLADIAEDPLSALIATGDALPSPAGFTRDTVFPLAVIDWTVVGVLGTFGVITDPQLGYTAGAFKVLDLRKFGTISDINISHDSRSYTSSSAEVPQNTTLTRSSAIYSDVLRWIAQGNAALTPTRPVVQTMARKSGRIKRVIVFSDTIPTGTGGLEIDISINGSTNSIFTTKPKMAAGVSGNTPNYSGSANTAVILSADEQGATAHGVVQTGLTGQIDSTANRVNLGDRLQLWITGVGSTVPGGNDLLIVVCIE